MASKIERYCLYPTYWDGQALANSEDPDKTTQDSVTEKCFTLDVGDSAVIDT